MIGHLQSYNYSGITLDAEMPMELFVPHLYNIIQIRLFTLIKIRKYIDQHTADLIYQQTILSVLDRFNYLVVFSLNIDIIKERDNIYYTIRLNSTQLP